MSSKRPLSLTILAWLFIITGVIAGWGMIAQYLRGQLSINLTVLFIFLGRGLLQLRPAAHTLAMAIVKLSWILLAAVVIASSFFDVGLVYVGNKIVTGPQRLLAVFGLAIVAGTLLAWVTRVLLRHDIKDLFRRQSV